MVVPRLQYRFRLGRIDWAHPPDTQQPVTPPEQTRQGGISLAQAAVHVEEIGMQVWVVYESKLGNTFKLARAIAEALAQLHKVRLTPVEEAGIPYAVDLLIVGCPHHRHHAPEGLLAWSFKLPPGALRGMHLMVYEIRYKRRSFWRRDGAARVVAKRLQALGGMLITKPRAFQLQRRGQPITEEEIRKGVQWAREVTGKFKPAVPATPVVPPGRSVMVTPHRSEWNN